MLEVFHGTGMFAQVLEHFGEVEAAAEVVRIEGQGTFVCQDRVFELVDLLVARGLVEQARDDVLVIVVQLLSCLEAAQRLFELLLAVQKLALQD
jgi:hypothetical protein